MKPRITGITIIVLVMLLAVISVEGDIATYSIDGFSYRCDSSVQSCTCTDVRGCGSLSTNNVTYEVCSNNYFKNNIDWCALSRGITRGDGTIVSAEEVAPAIRAATPAPGCTTQRCQQIDEVWKILQKVLSLSGEPTFKVWDPKAAWSYYEDVYPAPLPSVPSPPSSPTPYGPAPTTSPRSTTSEERDLLKIYNDYKSTIEEASRIHSVPTSLLVAIIYKESRGDPRAVSSGAAAGLMQMVPGTFIGLGGKISFQGITIPNTVTNTQNYRKFMSDNKHWVNCAANDVSPCNSCDRSKCDYTNDERFRPEKVIPLGAKHLQQLKSSGTWSQALEKYYSSPDRALNTQYASEVLEYQRMFENIGVTMVSLRDVRSGTKIRAGLTPELIRDLNLLPTTDFILRSGANPQVTTRLYDAVVALNTKARASGFTKKIIITSAKRDGETEGSLHNTGNTIDIDVQSTGYMLTLNERLILIKAAIEVGFGEIYHGTNSGADGLSTTDNSQLKCFWLSGHQNHIHLGLETTTQGWENCIRTEPGVS